MKLEPTLVDCLFDAAGDAAETARLTLEVYGGTFQVGEGTCSLARALPRFLLEVDNVAVEVAAAYGVEQTCGQNGVLRGLAVLKGQAACGRFTVRASRCVPGDGSARKRSSPLSASRTAASAA